MSRCDPRLEQYTLTIVSVPDKVPADARLKRMLKAMLRSYGFRVVEIVPGHGDGQVKSTPNSNKSEK